MRPSRDNAWYFNPEAIMVVEGHAAACMGQLRGGGDEGSPVCHGAWGARLSQPLPLPGHPKELCRGGSSPQGGVSLVAVTGDSGGGSSNPILTSPALVPARRGPVLDLPPALQPFIRQKAPRGRASSISPPPGIVLCRRGAKFSR